MYETFGRVADVPPAVLASTKEYVDEYLATHDRFFPPTHRFCGNDSERASVGLPGHCWVCAIVGHVVAHPELGCGDVHCNLTH
jgi:hypothetical protein